MLSPKHSCSSIEGHTEERNINAKQFISGRDLNYHGYWKTLPHDNNCVELIRGCAAYGKFMPVLGLYSILRQL